MYQDKCTYMCHEEKLHVSTLNSSEMNFINYHNIIFNYLKVAPLKRI